MGSSTGIRPIVCPVILTLALVGAGMSISHGPAQASIGSTASPRPLPIAPAQGKASIYSGAFKTIQRVSSALESKRNRSNAAVGAPKGSDLQLIKLETTRQILNYQDTHPNQGPEEVFALAHLALVRQALSLGIRLPSATIRKAGETSPTNAALALIARYGVTPTKEQRDKVNALDHLPGRVKNALGGYIAAFLVYHDATKSAYAKFDKAKADELETLIQRSVTPGDPLPQGILKNGNDPVALLADMGVHNVDAILSARLSLLDAARPLAEAIRQTPNLVPAPVLDIPAISPDVPSPRVPAPQLGGRPGSGGPSPLLPGEGSHAPAAPPAPTLPPLPLSGIVPAPPTPPSAPLTPPGSLRLSSANPTMDECAIAVAPALCIELGQNDNTYRANYALQIDAGGNDTYLNNAGGSGVTGVCLVGASAALLDVSGNDRYNSPSKCGGNGAGRVGSGMLIDLAGDDSYVAGNKGQVGLGAFNGAGGGEAFGFLLDGGGNDEYHVRGKAGFVGPNGGGYSASVGFLLDIGGDDSYTVGDRSLAGACTNDTEECKTYGANGGGAAGSGTLIDLGGDDSYEAGGIGVNGGVSIGSGFLLDSGGNDIYKGGDNGVNGGSGPGEGAGFLFDATGNDSYVAGKDGTNGGGASGSPTGLLIDAGGLDSYLDHNVPSGTGADKTVIPKGAGAQIDDNSPSADLSVAISDSPDPVPAGRNLTYSITVRNTGPGSRVGAADPSKMCDAGSSPVLQTALVQLGVPACNPPGVDAGPDVAEEVTLTDELPSGVNFTSANPSSGSCTKSGATLTCKLGNLAASPASLPSQAGPGPGTATVTIVVTPHNPAGTVISNKVSVASATPDPDQSNNTATAKTTVIKETGGLSVSIDDAAPVKQGNQGSQNTASFNVSLSGPSEMPVKVDYATADGTATVSDGDYRAASGTLVFDPGQTRKTINVPIFGDNVSEADETFFVNLSKPTNAILDRGQATATILNEAPLPVVSITGEAVPEGNSGVTVVDFTVTVSPPSGQTVSVDYATADGTATVADGDYRAASGTVSLAPGQKTATLQVLINGDKKPENDETFFVNLSNPKNVVIGQGQGQGQGTIVDGYYPTIAISPYVTVKGGNSGTTAADVTVSLSIESEQVVSVDYTTMDGAATAPTDYEPTKGTLTFGPHEKTKRVSVRVGGDTAVEPDENFFVKFSNPRNGSFAEQSEVAGVVGVESTQIQYKQVSDRAEIVIVNDNGSKKRGTDGATGGVFFTQHLVDVAAAGPPIPFPNKVGARHIVEKAVSYAVDGRVDSRLLLAAPRRDPSDTKDAAGQILKDMGFEACPATGPRGCFDVADYIGAPRLNLNTVAFSDYDAVVVSTALPTDSSLASPGGAEVLVRRQADLLDAVRSGTGLVIFGEFWFEGGPFHGFLPCLGPPFDDYYEEPYRATSFGHSLGLSDADFEQQSTDDSFAAQTCGLEAVDLNPFGFPVSLAGHLFQSEGPPKQPATPPLLPVAAAGAFPPQAPRPPGEGPPSLPRQDLSRPVPPRPVPAEQLQAPPALNQAQQQTQQQVQEQMQAQMHQLAQANNVQAQPAVHIQGAVTREKEKAPAVTLARVEERAPQPNQASARQGEHLASARQTALPAGAAIGVVALMAGLLGLSRPRKQRARRVTVLHIKSGPIHKTIPPPRHRGR